MIRSGYWKIQEDDKLSNYRKYFALIQLAANESKSFECAQFEFQISLIGSGIYGYSAFCSIYLNQILPEIILELCKSF